MDHRPITNWPVDRAEAEARLAETAKAVSLLNFIHDPELVAAVDTAYGVGAEYVYASAVVTRFPDIEEVERTVARARAPFPYIPGLLFFREGPAITEALERLKSTPDVIIVHGHGVAHPRRCGMASQIGVLFDVPSIGCCRRILAGRHRPVGDSKGSAEPIMLGGQEVGWAYRSKDHVKPIFISPGHKCDLATARDIVVRNLRGFRLPEPLRLAHLFANKHKRNLENRRTDDVGSPHTS